MFLVGAILSFADPITDLLTLVKFYRADHKAWFGVGLAFVILPCLVFPVLYYRIWCWALPIHRPDTRKCTQIILCGSYPFSAAFARLQGFVVSLKSLGFGVSLDILAGNSDYDKELDDSLLSHIELAVLFESVTESAPQFILQLYAVIVQEESVEIIQIISLPISFLSLVWAFTTTDELIIRDVRDLGAFKIRHKLVFFTKHLFLLSSRLFAVCFFTVSYKWWVIGVLLFHTFVVVTVDNIWYCQRSSFDLREGFTSVLFACVHWLRDDLSVSLHSATDEPALLRRMQLLSNGFCLY